MAKGQDDPSDRDDGKVLAPDELDITDDEHVAEIEEGRYVVSPNDPIDDTDTPATAPTDSASQGPPTDEGRTKPGPEPAPDPDPQTQSQSQPNPAPERAPEPELTEQRVHDWLEAEFDGANSRYGFDVTAKFDGPVQQRQMMSNDVVTIFESLILWYAQHIDTSTPVEEVLGILLMESNVPIRYPPEALQRIVQSSGLRPSDSIADLMEAIDADDGLKF